MMELKININDTAKVKLTDRGKRLLMDYHKEISRQVPGYKIPVCPWSADGYYEDQIHSLMRIFGHDMGIASPQAPFGRCEMAVPLKSVEPVEDGEPFLPIPEPMYVRGTLSYDCDVPGSFARANNEIRALQSAVVQRSKMIEELDNDLAEKTQLSKVLRWKIASAVRLEESVSDEELFEKFTRVATIGMAVLDQFGESPLRLRESLPEGDG